jgi:hypothetical protein
MSKNTFILCDGYVEVVIYNKNREEIARALIDLDDLDRVNNHTWTLTSHGYLECKVKQKLIRLHRFITNATQGTDVDHKDGNKLDNRKNNLRVCTHQQNCCNIKGYSHNTSGVTGVYYDKVNDKWCAKIKVNDKNIWLGRHKTFNEAVKVRKEAEERYFGEFQNKG